MKTSAPTSLHSRPVHALLTAAIATAGLAPCAWSQGQVIPSAALSRPGNTSVSRVFWGTVGGQNEAHAQFLYDVGEVGAQVMTIRTLQVRADPEHGSRAHTSQVRIAMSVSNADPQNASSTFAQNRGANAVTVFQGTVSLPASTTGSWPRPWEAPIVLQQPFSFDASQGRSLVIEFWTTQGQTGAWRLDANRRDDGRSWDVWSAGGCLNSTGGLPTSYTYYPERMIVGGSFQAGIGGYPINQPSLQMNAMIFGFEGPGGSWGGRSLPIRLSTLGLPAPSACAWAIDYAASSPLRYSFQPNGRANSGFLSMPAAVTIPNDPSLAHAEFYTQAIAVDTDQNGQPFVLPSVAVRYRIGSGESVPGSSVFRTMDNAAADGSLLRGSVPALRLN